MPHSTSISKHKLWTFQYSDTSRTFRSQIFYDVYITDFSRINDNSKFSWWWVLKNRIKQYGNKLKTAENQI